MHSVDVLAFFEDFCVNYSDTSSGGEFKCELAKGFSRSKCFGCLEACSDWHESAGPSFLFGLGLRSQNPDSYDVRALELPKRPFVLCELPICAA